jgi:hypothetical protein
MKHFFFDREIQMKTHSKQLTIVLIVAAAMLALFTLDITGAEKAKLPNKKEVKELIANARTPADHERLAAYYRAEAARMQAEEQEHSEQAAEYFKDPSRHPIPKYPTMGQHCRDLAGYYGQAATKAAELASMHEELARKPAQ